MHAESTEVLELNRFIWKKVSCVNKMIRATKNKKVKWAWITPTVIELATILTLNIAFYFIFRAVDFLEMLYALSQRHEDYELDEIIPVSFTLAFSFGIFFLYRWRLAERLSRVASESAVRDSLTGLYNRRIVDEIVSIELNRSRRFDREFSIIMTDIDNFKLINDALGHRAGDEVLKEVATILSRNIRKLDSAIRWGGEEFVIICPETKKDGAIELAEKLRKKIDTHEFLVAGHITASFGIVFGTQNESVDSLFQKVDEALYEAKEQGKNRVVVV